MIDGTRRDIDRPSLLAPLERALHALIGKHRAARDRAGNRQADLSPLSRPCNRNEDRMMIGCIGIVSPGAMGTEMGRSLASRGTRVVVALEGRSDRSRERSEVAGLEDVGTLAELVRVSEVILSIVPPAFAVEVAWRLGQAMTDVGSQPVVIDANAISPARATEVANAIERSGGRYVDGGIVGGPPHPGRRTDLVLSGKGADKLVSELTTDELVPTCVGSDPTSASALKMCYASWTKGTSALLISIRAVARTSRCRTSVDRPVGACSAGAPRPIRLGGRCCGTSMAMGRRDGRDRSNLRGLGSAGWGSGRSEPPIPTTDSVQGRRPAALAGRPVRRRIVLRAPNRSTPLILTPGRWSVH